ncbi:MAG TPA: cobalamin-dependent protein, partial [Acidimicrobiales bacterium]|nr:cobalamin-dependent protein [Acidimicrobiales bacterium]
MRVLLLSTYELGHQPLHLASPAAALQAAGHEVHCVDLAAEPWDQEAVAWGSAVAISVPMHTAMRLALRAAERVRAGRPDLPICLYGLYAGVSHGLTLGRLVDHAVVGEYEPELLAWVERVAAGPGSPSEAESAVPVLDRGRGRFSVPARDLLPPLSTYAHLAMGGQERAVGYVEASHGCASRCRHCPVAAVYDGRVRIVAQDVVLEDIGRLVAAGARHITFGDPDFLNAVHHSLRVVGAMHD